MDIKTVATKKVMINHRVLGILGGAIIGLGAIFELYALWKEYKEKKDEI